MAFTVQTVVDKARVFINDASKVRVSDATMAGFVNDAVLILATNRPDMFMGQYTKLPTGTLALSASVPIEDRFMPALVDWVVARAESIEDEYTVDGRAAAFYTLAGIEIGGEK